jgi:hypothetical protein
MRAITWQPGGLPVHESANYLPPRLLIIKTQSLRRTDGDTLRIPIAKIANVRISGNQIDKNAVEWTDFGTDSTTGTQITLKTHTGTIVRSGQGLSRAVFHTWRLFALNAHHRSE